MCYKSQIDYENPPHVGWDVNPRPMEVGEFFFFRKTVATQEKVVTETYFQMREGLETAQTSDSESTALTLELLRSV